VTQALADVLRRNGVLGLAIAVAVALALWELVRALVWAVAIQLLQKGDDDLSFSLRGESFRYGESLASILALLLVGAALIAIWRLGAHDTKNCPDCLSEIPRAAAVCRECSLEVAA
jgi:large conductance mechanosensitive channel